MNTEYLDTCCSVLESKMEYESDMDLVQMVRIQKLAQSIAVTWDSKAASLTSSHTPPTMIIQTFQEQLNSFQASLPPYLQENCELSSPQLYLEGTNTTAATIKCRFIIAEILLYEIALNDSLAIAQPERLNLLWRCLQSVKAYMRLRFENYDIHRPKFICLMAGDFVFSAQVALKLLSLRTPGWDLPLVWEKLAMDRWIEGQTKELGEVLELRSQASWTKELQARGLAPVVVDPFQKLLISLKGFSALLSKESERNMPITPPEEEQMVPSQDAGFLAGIDAEMSMFDDFHLTQFDFLAMDVSTPQWEGY